MTIQTIIGILIPFAGTSLGAAMVFLLKDEIWQVFSATARSGTDRYVLRLSALYRKRQNRIHEEVIR